jgi:hypothetical protein
LQASFASLHLVFFSLRCIQVPLADFTRGKMAGSGTDTFLNEEYLADDCACLLVFCFFSEDALFLPDGSRPPLFLRLFYVSVCVF